MRGRAKSDVFDLKTTQLWPYVLLNFPAQTTAWRAMRLAQNPADPKMFKQIEAFINDVLGDDEPRDRDRHDIKLASAALLIHCAKADGVACFHENKVLRDILMQRFEMSPEETQLLLEEAQTLEEDAVDVHRFTRVLYASLDRDERLEFVRLLWELTHADKKIDHGEQSLVMLIAQLLHVEVHDAVTLRQSITSSRQSD